MNFVVKQITWFYESNENHETNLIYYLFVVLLLILQCHDVELNPGPARSRYENRNIK